MEDEPADWGLLGLVMQRSRREQKLERVCEFESEKKDANAPIWPVA